MIPDSHDLTGYIDKQKNKGGNFLPNPYEMELILDWIINAITPKHKKKRRNRLPFCLPELTPIE